MRAKVVIGIAYGDEGKGQTVHALCSSESVVVRFNGGCQAGHTVVHGGKRRVFSHFGSGTLKGAKTYLSRHFVCHPLAFLSEWYDLAANGINPVVKVSPECPVTTIYDVAINRLLEDSRGNLRHGSVGVGFGETLERNERNRYRFTVGDLQCLGRDARINWVRTVRDEWVPIRCSELGLNSTWIPSEIMSPENISRFVLDCEEFLHRVTVVPDTYVQEQGERVVFEGAQGLLLDRDYGQFPHVTRSNTGLTNVVNLIDSIPLEVFYVTRAYTTRHGAGPLPYELIGLPYPEVRDETNIPGPYQGGLRFSYLNLDAIWNAVAHDKTKLPSNSTVRSVVTCLDQVPNYVNAIREGRKVQYRTSQLSRIVSNHLDCDEASHAQFFC